MTTQTFNPTDLSQSAANWAVAQRMVGPFAPHAQVAPNLTVALDPGYLLSGTTLTEVNAQSTPALTPPASGFRIDRVVIDRTTGAVSVIAGTANSLTPPALTAGTLPVARVFLETTTTAITNESIVDERALFDLTPDSPQVICRADLNGSAQTGVAINTETKVNLGNAPINVGNAFDTTNKWFKPTIAGHYAVFGQVDMQQASNATLSARMFKNGALVSYGTGVTPVSGAHATANVSDIVYLDGINDRIELYVFTDNTGGGTVAGGTNVTYFTAQRIG
ncbi:MAG TPA: hypothetical protein VGE72_01680 [Azospirillum sp.]